MTLSREQQAEFGDLVGGLLDGGAKSVFWYGSRARNDEHPTSDWNIGAAYGEKYFKGQPRYGYHTTISMGRITVMPFNLRELQSGTVTPPFNRAFFLEELRQTAKTIRGTHVVERLAPVTIQQSDMEDDIAAHISAAYLGLEAFVRSESVHHRQIGRLAITKAGMLGLRTWVTFADEDTRMPGTYREAADRSHELLPPQYSDLPHHLLDARQRPAAFDQDLAVATLDMLQFAREQIVIER